MQVTLAFQGVTIPGWAEKSNREGDPLSSLTCFTQTETESSGFPCVGENFLPATEIEATFISGWKTVHKAVKFDCFRWSEWVSEIWPGGLCTLNSQGRIEPISRQLPDSWAGGLLTAEQVFDFACYLGESLRAASNSKNTYLLLPTPVYQPGRAGNWSSETEPVNSSQLYSAYWPPAAKSDYQMLPKLAELLEAGLIVGGFSSLDEVKKHLSIRPLQVFYQSPQPLLGADSLVSLIASHQPELAQAAQKNLSGVIKNWHTKQRFFHLSENATKQTSPVVSLNSSRIAGGATGGGLGALLHALGAWLTPFYPWWAGYSGLKNRIEQFPDLVITNQTTLNSWQLATSPLATLSELTQTMGVALLGYSYQNKCSFAEIRDHGIDGWYALTTEKSTQTNVESETKKSPTLATDHWFQAGRRAAQTWAR